MTTSELKTEACKLLEENILPYWMERMPDREHGGFYGRIDGHEQLDATADKGAILNARILWAFSAAYRVLRKPVYLEMATRAKEYIEAYFIDPDYGGVYWSLDYLGRPKDTKKQTYAIGFMVYGFSEFARATGDKQALQTALDLYASIEKHALDHEYGGYIEALTRSWQPIADMRLSDKDENYPKSQNTHLHVIEPYTNLYRALVETKHDDAPALASRISDLINIFTDKILNPATHHLDLFFTMDWQREIAQQESYGHDIECSWLLHEAALVLGNEAIIKKVEPIVRMVAKASEKGLRPDGSMIHEGPIMDEDRHWWVQAEAVVGFFNLWQHFGDEEALQKAIRCWQFIQDKLIDREHGEWFWSVDEQGRINRKDDKAGFWKCPYHNSRMCLEIITRHADS